MRTIIAGGRDITDVREISVAMAHVWHNRDIAVSEVVCGGAEGADDLGDQWAKSFVVPVRYFLIDPFSAYHRLRNLRPTGVDRAADDPRRYGNVTIAANWDRDGKGAGHIRNRAMADYADALVALWDGKSAGTQSMIFQAHRRGLHVHVHLTGRLQ